MSMRHLGIKAGKHLNLDDSHKSVINKGSFTVGPVINVAMEYAMLLLLKS